MISTNLNPLPRRRWILRGRLCVVVLVTITLGFVLPPSVNLNHFRARLSDSLSRSVGLPVSVEDVRLRLLPSPGFIFRHLRISGDDEFGAEPILQTAEDYGEHSVATLRLTSLWRGRFEIASVSLTQASLNLSRTADGHWNLERLISRASQVPSAPTSKKKPETRARFPYIEVKESRINFKFGAEKKPFTLADAEFALWLPAENRWNVRLKAIPLRTDENISDTGTIKLSGSFDRALQFSQTPFHFEMNWERPEVSAITRIARGHDPGWRGTVDLNAEIKGTPADFRTHAIAEISEFRRYDIARPSPLDLRLTCDYRFRAEVPESRANDQLDLTCRLPLDSGALTAHGELHRLGKSPDFSVRLFASDVPMPTLVQALLHAKSTLPDDLTAEGVVNGGWLIEGRPGTPVNWHGAFTATDAVLKSQSLDKPLIFPHTLVVNFNAVTPIASSRKRNRMKSALATTIAGREKAQSADAATSRAVVEAFTVDIGGDLEVSAAFDPEGYHISANGSVAWQRLLQVARVIGLRPPPTDLKGSGVLTAEYSGEWQHFAPATVSGQADIRSAVLSLRGFREPLHITDGVLKFDGPVFRAEKITGNFDKSGLKFVGDFAGSRQCERHVVCDVTFSLSTDDVSDSALIELVSTQSSSLGLPFFSSGPEFEAKWLLDVDSSGTIIVQHLTTRDIDSSSLVAQLQVSRGKVLVRNWSSEIFGGKHRGELTLDFSGKEPAITASGTVQRTSLAQINTALDNDMGTGTLDLQYRLQMHGKTTDELVASLKGSGQFTWHDGTIKNKTLGESPDATLAFSTWSGRFEVERQHIALQSSKMISTAGIREVAGDILLNRPWNLKFTRPNGSGLVAAAGMVLPVVPKQSPKQAETQ